MTNNSVAVSDLPSLIQNIHAALSGLGNPSPVPEPKQEPAVSIRASVKPDYPMVAPDYAEKRRALAKSIGLGRKRKPAAPVPAAKAAKPVTRHPRAPKES